MRQAVLPSGSCCIAGIRKAMTERYSGYWLMFGPLVLLFLILLGGCADMGRTTQSANVAAQKYLEQRYGGTFTYSAPWGSFYAGKGTAQMLFTSSELNAEVYVEARQEDGEYTFRDNYLAVKYRQQMEDAIQAVADDCFGSVKVFYEVYIQPLNQELGPDTDFQEYSAHVNSSGVGTVAVSSAVFREDEVETFVGRLSNAGLGAHLRLVVIDESQYEELDLAGVEMIIGTDAVHFSTVLDIQPGGTVKGSLEG